LTSEKSKPAKLTGPPFWVPGVNVFAGSPGKLTFRRRLYLGDQFFPTKLNDDLQEYLTSFNIEWRLLEESAHFDAEAEWRSIFGQAFRRWARLRRGAKAEYEYLQQPCNHYLIIPFTSDIDGTPMHVCRQAIGAYECHGRLVALGQFCDAEFFVSPMDFEWTVLNTNEDHVIDGPYFIRHDWLR
jgi:hypothetical protein